MEIEVDLNKRYLVFFGIVVVFSLMGGVFAAIIHDVNDIDWNHGIISSNINVNEWVLSKGALAQTQICVGTGSSKTCKTSWPSGTAGLFWQVVTGTTPGIIYTGGNVGIGTASPGAKLDVGGILKAGTVYLNDSGKSQLGAYSCPAGQYMKSADFNYDANNAVCGSEIACTNQCSFEFQRRCVSSTITQTCQKSATNYCLEWNTQNCPSGRTCSNGACV